jgi:diguanylate cyclase (GGDEF)-like protein
MVLGSGTTDMDDPKAGNAGDGSADSTAADELSPLEERLVELGRDLESKFVEAGRLAQTHQDAGAPVILDDLMDSIFESFRPTIPYDRIGLAFLDDDRASVLTRWVRSDLPEIKLGVGYGELLIGSRLQEILDAGKSRILNDLAAHLKKNPQSRTTRLLLDEGMRSSLTFPLVMKEKPVGLVFFSSSEAETYSDQHCAAIQQCGSRLTRLIEKSRLYEELVDLNWQLGVARDALEYQSSHDTLTRLWSRAAILDIAQRELDRSRREGKSVAVMILDIDRFREINVAYGQQGGDAVLSGVAGRLAGALRSYEEVGRYSGEEFLLTLYACDERGVDTVSQRLRGLVSAVAIDTPMGEIPVTISLGSAVVAAANTVDLDVVIGLAEEALEKAKKEAPGSSIVVSI